MKKMPKRPETPAELARQPDIPHELGHRPLRKERPQPQATNICVVDPWSAGYQSLVEYANAGFHCALCAAKPPMVVDFDGRKLCIECANVVLEGERQDAAIAR